ncbi:TetR/AcrR family transcriptional regulator [Actinoplanes siamensis]|uniref:TetR/AcrR family transcriptional regulator n=1 Tax=Actinoplanes siamensis TaxID=1223317 RepID=UPI0035A246AA
MSGTSARTIAAAAGVNQALVFYHFGSVDDLLGAACRQATEQRVAHYADRFAAVTSLRELLQVGRTLHAAELAQGNVSVLAQMLAAAQSNERLAEPIRATFALWTGEIETVLRRVLTGSPIAEVADVPGLAQAISAAFVGLELFEGVDAAGGRRSMEAIDQLAVLVEVMDELGPLATRVLRSKIKKRL